MASSVETGPQEQVVFLKVSWETYEAIVSDLDEHTATRLAYDGETLELMAPEFEHGVCVALLNSLLAYVMMEWDINLYGTGSTTLKVKPVGAEPDASYYIEHAAQLDGLETIDLRTSPPPDLAVEVDISQQRMEKFSLYAKLRVPEFWRYDRAGLKAFELREHAYHEIAVSAVIPGLPLASLDVFLERRLQANRLPVLRDWKTWLLANRPAQE